MIQKGNNKVKHEDVIATKINESDRFVSKIGGGMANINYRLDDHVYGMDINGIDDYESKSYHLFEEEGMMHRHFDFVQVNDDVIEDLIFKNIGELQDYEEREKFIFFYHKDHLGSSTQISDRDAKIIHHPDKFVSKSFYKTLETTNLGLVWILSKNQYSHNFSNYESRLNIEYMPTGEQFSEQRDWWSTPYKFNSKELDAETGLYYYGARYYTPEIGIWLSVCPPKRTRRRMDPLSDKYPSLSPFAYCANNPVVLVDPDGREIVISETTNTDGSKNVNITFTAALVNNSSKKLSNSQMAKYRKEMKASLNDYVAGNYEGMSVTVDVSINIVNSESEARSNDHIISIVDKTSSESANAVGYTPEIGGRKMEITTGILDKEPNEQINRFKGTGLTSFNEATLKRTFGHEFGHLVGLPEGNFANKNLMNQSKDNPGTRLLPSQINQVKENFNNNNINKGIKK